MRRRYAHVPAAENPLRPEAPKSPWSRRIGFSAPSGHFRIVLFLIGCFRWVFVPSVYWLGSFFVSSSGFRFPMFSFFDYRGLLRSVRSSLMMAFRSVVFVRIGVLMRFVSRGCVSVPLVAFVFRRRFFHWGVHVVRPSPGFLYRSVRILFMALFFLLLSRSSFVFLLPSFSFAWLACSFPFRGFRLRSGRFVFVLRFRLSASPRRNAPSGGGVGPIGQGRPRARGRPPRGWRGGVGPGSRTRAAMGGRGRRRRGGRRPMGSAGRRTRRRR